MEVTNITPASSPSVFTHTNIVMGIVANRQQLDGIVAALKPLGINSIETLEGKTGVEFLEQRKRSLDGIIQYFLGDMEVETQAIYIDALKNDMIVFAVPVEPAPKESVVQAIKTVDARNIVHFGTFANQSYSPVENPRA